MYTCRTEEIWTGLNNPNLYTEFHELTTTESGTDTKSGGRGKTGTRVPLKVVTIPSYDLTNIVISDPVN